MEITQLITTMAMEQCILTTTSVHTQLALALIVLTIMLTKLMRIIHAITFQLLLSTMSLSHSLTRRCPPLECPLPTEETPCATTPTTTHSQCKSTATPTPMQPPTSSTPPASPTPALHKLSCKAQQDAQPSQLEHSINSSKHTTTSSVSWPCSWVCSCWLSVADSTKPQCSWLAPSQ